MTTNTRFTQKILTGAVALAIVAFAASARAEAVDQYVTILKVNGHARYSISGKMNDWKECKKGDVLRPGTLFQTAEDGNVDVIFGERVPVATTPMGAGAPSARALSYNPDKGPKANIVHIFPSSVLVVDKLTFEKTGMDDVSETQLDLRAGQIMGNVKKLNGASRYEVKIPNGVAGIRGTTYIIRGDGQVLVFSGSVVVS
ncbi:MAG TPA: FecR domain-containing protein, partial [Verrucomicrobiae bacterium]|nr:FecR domain-containing protein [Verrucomicrobiae bacterium]